MTYTIFREFADSWALLALFLFFVGAILWVWRPGARALHEDTAMVVFRNESAPDGDTTGRCAGTCESCRCGGALAEDHKRGLK